MLRVSKTIVVRVLYYIILYKTYNIIYEQYYNVVHVCGPRFRPRIRALSPPPPVRRDLILKHTCVRVCACRREWNSKKNAHLSRTTYTQSLFEGHADGGGRLSNRRFAYVYVVVIITSTEPNPAHHRPPGLDFSCVRVYYKLSRLDRRRGDYLTG